jgi:hypothetical protein
MVRFAAVVSSFVNRGSPYAGLPGLRRAVNRLRKFGPRSPLPSPRGRSIATVECQS